MQTAAGDGFTKRGLRFAAGLYLLLSILLPLRGAKLPALRIEQNLSAIPKEAVDAQDDLLLRQTELQLCEELKSSLSHMDVNPLSVEVDIHTDKHGRICLDRVSVLLDADDSLKQAEMDTALRSLVGTDAQISYEYG